MSNNSISPGFERYIRMIGPYDGNRRGPTGELNGTTFPMEEPLRSWELNHAMLELGVANKMIDGLDRQVVQEMLTPGKFKEAAEKQGLVLTLQAGRDKALAKLSPETRACINHLQNQVQIAMGGPICFGLAERDMSNGMFYVEVHRKEKAGPDEWMAEQPAAALYLDPRESHTAYLHPEAITLGKAD